MNGFAGSRPRVYSPLVIWLPGALIATMVEALPLRLGRYKLDDNLSIPLLTGAAMMVLQAAFG